eukprot:GHUV01023471.1.p2 GENE.GHUV01023471.1~~GHUV01023471.1.p2  ORF type:complete len:123 (-),score=23.95 GHUV01023471.1:260-628(-)
MCTEGFRVGFIMSASEAFTRWLIGMHLLSMLSTAAYYTLMGHLLGQGQTRHAVLWQRNSAQLLLRPVVELSSLAAKKLQPCSTPVHLVDTTYSPFTKSLTTVAVPTHTQIISCQDMHAFLYP